MMMSATNPPNPKALIREQQLIVRLRIDQLIASKEWEDAAELGASALRRGPPSAELLKIAVLLSGLGLVGGVDVRQTLTPLLSAPGLTPSDIAQGVAAVKRASADDVLEVSKAISEAVSGNPSRGLAVLRATVDLGDARVAPTLHARLPIGAAVRAALSEAHDAKRGAGLQLVAALARASPAALSSLLCPVLVRAALIEVPALQEYALASVVDLTAALARLPSTDEHAAPAAEQLISGLKLLSSCLWAPTIELQTIAAIGVSRIVLGATAALETLRASDSHAAGAQQGKARGNRARSEQDHGRGAGSRGGRGGGRTGDAGRGRGRAARSSLSANIDFAPSSDEDDDEAPPPDDTPINLPDVPPPHADDSDPDARADAVGGAGAPLGTLLAEVFDVEQLLADLALRYTAAQPPHVASLPKPAAAAHAALMTILQAGFDALAAAHCAAEVGNTIVWLLLGAAESGHLDGLRAAPPPLPHDHTYAHGHAHGHAAEQLLDARTLRCVRFLAGLIGRMRWADEEARRRVMRDLVEAAVLNLQLEHALHVARATVAAWLGVPVGEDA